MNHEVIHKETYNLGYELGVRDHDNDDTNIIFNNQYGYFFNLGYEAGQKDAAVRNWYIVSLDYDTRKINSYMNSDDKINGWTTDKEKATKFKNEKVVNERLSNLCNTCGRGTYTIKWE